MRRMSAFIFDCRYTVPTLRLDLPVAPGQEYDVADRILRENPAYLAVEIRDGEEIVAKVEQDHREPSQADFYQGTSYEG